MLVSGPRAMRSGQGTGMASINRLKRELLFKVVF
jgi:hypothetical protein